MKLIDLLVQELPKRGGWPNGANYAVQDADGTVKFAKTLTYLHYLAGEWRSNENGFDWIYGDRPFDGNFVTKWTADDNHQAIISMARYECEISNNELQEQPTNEWNGEGLPPVGCECEFISNDTSWGVVRVIGMDDDKVVIKPSGEIYYGITTSNRQVFRPIQSEAERKRDAAVEAMQREADDGDNWIYSEYEIIYDAIAAGKIPGVKLDD
ncbi:hypothetical protein DO303_21935 [Salmonella enterica]|nr:hypothetical protein [Salmonella enterica]